MEGHFPQREKDANRGSMYDLPESHSIFNQKSDTIELSPTAKEKLAQENEEKSTNDQKLSKEEQKEVKELERIDRQVKSRELTHRAVARALRMVASGLLGTGRESILIWPSLAYLFPSGPVT